LIGAEFNTLDDLERQSMGLFGFFRDIGQHKSISFTRRLHGFGVGGVAAETKLLDAGSG